MYITDIVSAVFALFSGLTIMAMGDWKKFRLKFAAVALSTVTCLFILCSILATNYYPTCSMSDPMCFDIQIYALLRNVSFIVFHIAVGHDAIKFKETDRRKHVGGYS